MISWHLKAVDRGLISGVPVVDVYLIRSDGGAEQCVLHSWGKSLSPVLADELCEGLGELGIGVVRERHPLAEPVGAA